jgi:hypothetical protein
VDDPHLKQSGGLVPMTTEDGGTTQVVLLPLLMGGRRPGRAPGAAAHRRAHRRNPRDAAGLSAAS